MTTEAAQRSDEYSTALLMSLHLLCVQPDICQRWATQCTVSKTDVTSVPLCGGQTAARSLLAEPDQARLRSLFLASKVPIIQASKGRVNWEGYIRGTDTVEVQSGIDLLLNIIHTAQTFQFLGVPASLLFLLSLFESGNGRRRC
jgi:hypothetical protein